MKYFLSTLTLSLSLLPSLFAQSDSLRFSKEQGIVPTQRFIDRHERIFMTKEPTKWMAWAGFQALRGDFAPSFGMEFKFTPGWSGALIVHTMPGGVRPTNGITAELRHYYDMKRRIQESKNANNFTGNYISLGLGRMDDKYRTALFSEDNRLIVGAGREEIYTTLSFNWGAQRRFLTHGLANYGLTLGLLRSDLNRYYDPMGSSVAGTRDLDFGISTFWTTAFAFGDLKPKRASIPCELVSCSDTRRYILKVAWPKLYLGLNRQSLSTSFGYEKQLGSTAFSLNTQWDVRFHSSQGVIYSRKPNTNKISRKVSGFDNYLLNLIQLQPRYYFGQSFGSVRALSGLYAGASLLHVFERRDWLGQTYSAIEAGPTLGYQQKVFGKGYLDFGLTIGTPVSILNQSSPQPISLTNRTNFNVGFAF